MPKRVRKSLARFSSLVNWVPSFCITDLGKGDM
jgi:hypothetical protein